MWLPNPLDDTRKHIEWLQKNYLKASHLTICSKIDSVYLLSSYIQLNLNCNAVFTGFSLVSLFKIYMIFKSSEEVHLNPLSASVALI